MIIQKKFKELRKNGYFIYILCKGFYGNKYNSYVHIAQSANVTSTRNIYEKTVIKWMKKGFQRRILNPLEHLR